MIDANIGSAKDNMKSAIHNWYKFTAGFSYKFVDLIVDNMDTIPNCIYESFCWMRNNTCRCPKERHLINWK